MNFLAHIYLSGDDDGIMVGNFIADFVKGKKKDDYPYKIKKGIELHRKIDDFTDHHAITRQSKARFNGKYGKYAGVIVDLYYDHYLAANFPDFSSVPLADFSANSYRILQQHHDILPEGVHYFLPFMIERNWLLNYASIEGIGRALSGLSIRVSFENKMNEAVNDLKEHYADFESDFREFFPELQNFVKSEI